MNVLCASTLVVGKAQLVPSAAGRFPLYLHTPGQLRMAATFILLLTHSERVCCPRRRSITHSWNLSSMDSDVLMLAAADDDARDKRA